MKKWLMRIIVIAAIVIIGTMLIGEEKDDVHYSILEESKNDDSNRIRVETESTSEESLRNIVEQVKKENEGLDAVWLWIYKKDSNDLLAKAMIPYNEKGKAMIGSDNLIFESK